MHEVNRYHSELLNQTKAYGLDLNLLRKKYNLPFAIKLFKHVQKRSLSKSKISPIYPKSFLMDETDSMDNYIEELENAGFKMKTRVEDFIDEDTGQIVGIKRFIFKPIKLNSAK